MTWESNQHAMHKSYLELTDGQDEIQHYGIKGQKWGLRRYQNDDGTLTSEGKEHYYKKYKNKYDKLDKKEKSKTEKAEKYKIETAKFEAKKADAYNKQLKYEAKAKKFRDEKYKIPFKQAVKETLKDVNPFTKEGFKEMGAMTAFDLVFDLLFN